MGISRAAKIKARQVGRPHGEIHYVLIDRSSSVGGLLGASASDPVADTIATVAQTLPNPFQTTFTYTCRKNGSAKTARSLRDGVTLV